MASGPAPLVPPPDWRLCMPLLSLPHWNYTVQSQSIWKSQACLFQWYYGLTHCKRWFAPSVMYFISNIIVRAGRESLYFTDCKGVFAFSSAFSNLMPSEGVRFQLTEFRVFLSNSSKDHQIEKGWLAQKGWVHSICVPSSLKREAAEVSRDPYSMKAA